jgi:D-glycero-D-manno-heptose 1,7-bisphosphate phosphatase
MDGIDAMVERQAVFLDRDGVLNRSEVRGGLPYAPTRLEEFELLPGSYDAVSQIREKGYLTIVVTNQPDITTGKQSPEVLAAMHNILRRKMGVDDIFVCTHLDSDGCGCRKPKPGMLLAAAEKWGIDLQRSVMVGDRWRDVGAGKAAGCATVFIEYGYAELSPEGPDAVATSLADSVPFILEELKRRCDGGPQ